MKFIVKDPNGREDLSKGDDGKLRKFLPASSPLIGGIGPVKGYDNFALRSTLLNYLVNGTLIVEVHMRRSLPGRQSAPFVPENPFIQNALTDFGNEETADVEFELGGAAESGRGRRKRAKTSTRHSTGTITRFD